MWLTGEVNAARYCRRCGEALAPDAAFCAACGTAVAYSPGTADPGHGSEGPPAPEAGTILGTMATYGQRVGAWAIDCLIVYGLLFVVAVIVVAVYFPDASDTESGQTGLGLLLVLLVPLYSAFLHGLWHGQTIGKRAVGIAVRRVDRTEIGLGRSFLRSYARAMCWVFFPVWVLDSLWPLWEGKRRTLHDLVAETVVIVRPRDSL